MRVSLIWSFEQGCPAVINISWQYKSDDSPEAITDEAMRWSVFRVSIANSKVLDQCFYRDKSLF